MDQQLIDKLLEIKKLYEAGILTKEEMEAEKAKVLHPTTPQQTTEPKESASETDGYSECKKSSSQEIKKNNGLVYIAITILVVSIIILIFIAMCGGKRTSSVDDSYDVATDTTAIDDSGEDFAVDDYQEQTQQDYAGSAEDYGGLDGY